MFDTMKALPVNALNPVPPCATATSVAAQVPVPTVPKVVIEFCPTYVDAISIASMFHYNKIKDTSFNGQLLSPIDLKKRLAKRNIKCRL